MTSLRSHLLAVFGAVTCMVVVTGCAGMRYVDVDSTAFASWPAGVVAAPGSSYRFDRLPSQQGADMQRDQLETMTRDALARKGLQLNPNLASYGVQVALSSQLVAGNGYYGGPTLGIGGGSFSGGSGGFSSAGVGFSFPIGGASSGDYRSELVVLIRNLQTNAVVYEARSYAQSVSASDPAVRNALVDSALRNFPLATAGTLRSRVNLSPP